MNKILEHVKDVGCFIVPQYKGGYDNIPFTHEEHTSYVQQLFDELEAFAVDYSVPGDDELAPITILVMPFEHAGETFVLRHLEMGEWVDQLMTLKFHQEQFPNEKLQ